jgi:16S rRNA (cytosine1402-N4)-methyltransferase
LDLRFDPSSGVPASEWLATVEPAELERVLREFGEEPRPGSTARALLAARERDPIATTGQLRDVVAGRAGRPGEHASKSLSRVFQALRIVVNDELGELDRFLARLPDCLADRGRVVILSYHSLEDRRVKHAFRDAARDCVCPSEFPMCACGGGHAWLRQITTRPILAGASEVERNPRARSVRLRAAERVAPGNAGGRAGVAS